jgi:hypothetical protein
VSRKLARFDFALGQEGLYRPRILGRLRQAVGNAVEGLPVHREHGSSVVIEGLARFANVRISSGYVPGLVEGRIYTRDHGGDPIDLAVVINGTIQAVTRARTGGGDGARFQALVPESAFSEGANSIRVLRIRNGRDENLELYAVRQDQYRLAAAGRAIRTPYGRIPVVTDESVFSDIGACRVHADRLVCIGWCFDKARNLVPTSYLAFADGEFAAAVKPVARADVAAVHGPHSRESGLELSLSVFALPRGVRSQIRVFALFEDRRALELAAPRG